MTQLAFTAGVAPTTSLFEIPPKIDVFEQVDSHLRAYATVVSALRELNSLEKSGIIYEEGNSHSWGRTGVRPTSSKLNSH